MPGLLKAYLRRIKIMANFERGFTRGMASGIPAGVSLFERMSESEDRRKEREAAATRQGKQDVIAADERAYKRQQDELENKIKYGGYNPADIASGAEQRALLSEPELSSFQKAITAGQDVVPYRYAGGKYNPKAEKSMQGYENFLTEKKKYAGRSLEDQLAIIAARAEAQMQIDKARADAKYGGMGDVAPLTENADAGKGNKWYNFFGKKEEKKDSLGLGI